MERLSAFWPLQGEDFLQGADSKVSAFESLCLPSAVSAHTINQASSRWTLALKFRAVCNSERTRDLKKISSFETEREKKVHKDNSIKDIKMSLV